MSDTGRAALATYLTAVIPATAPRPAADAPAAAYRRPAWLDGRTETPRRTLVEHLADAYRTETRAAGPAALDDVA